MKDLLIVATPSSSKHEDDCNKIGKAILKLEAQLQRPLENTFLVSGPKSFEAAMLACDIAQKESLPVAVFEIESVVLYPKQA